MGKRRVKASRPVYETWAERRNPENATRDIWIEEENPYNVYEYAMKVYHEMSDKVPDARNIRIVTLDDDYKEWLEHEGLPDEVPSRVQYKNELDSEGVNHLMMKNKMNRAYHVLFIPIEVGGDAEKTIEVPDELPYAVCRSMQISLEEFYGFDSIYMPGCVLTPEEAAAAKLKLQMLAVEYFENNRCLPYHEKNTQVPDCHSAALFIPFVYSAPCKRADIDLAWIGREHPEWIDPADVNPQTEIPFEDDLQEMLDHSFKSVVKLGRQFATTAEIKDVYEDMQDRIMAGYKSNKAKVKIIGS